MSCAKGRRVSDAGIDAADELAMLVGCVVECEGNLAIRPPKVGMRNPKATKEE